MNATAPLKCVAASYGSPWWGKCHASVEECHAIVDKCHASIERCQGAHAIPSHPLPLLRCITVRCQCCRSQRLPSSKPSTPRGSSRYTSAQNFPTSTVEWPSTATLHTLSIPQSTHATSVVYALFVCISHSALTSSINVPVGCRMLLQEIIVFPVAYEGGLARRARKGVRKATFWAISNPYPCGTPPILSPGVLVRQPGGLWVPRLLPLHFGAFEGVSTIKSSLKACPCIPTAISKRQKSRA